MTRKANVEDSLFECTLPIIFEVAPREPKKKIGEDSVFYKNIVPDSIP